MHTVFPHIVYAETFLFLNLEIQRSQYIRPKVTVHKCSETIQGRKLYEEIRNLGDMLLSILQQQQPFFPNCLPIFLTAILAGLRNCFFFQSTFSQTWFPLFLNFRYDIWISLCISFPNQISDPVYSCLFLSVSISLDFQYQIWFYYYFWMIIENTK